MEGDAFTPPEGGTNSSSGDLRPGDLQVNEANLGKNTTSATTGRHRWGRCGLWNLGGQKLDLLDIPGRDLDVVVAQEVSRGEVGWDTSNTELFHWVRHQHDKEWRGVAIGIAHDKLDCIIQRVANRGIWVLARLKNIGRVVLGTMHCHTGAANAIYQAAVLQFVSSCPRKWRHYPLLCGTDANEEIKWHEDGDGRTVIHKGSNNLDLLTYQMLQLGVQPVAPRADQRLTPSHFPRDETRGGRQIDVWWGRLLDCSEVSLEPDRRFIIGTDHALLHLDLFTATKYVNRWGNDSRARYMCAEIPLCDISDAKTLLKVASQCTCPRRTAAYQDSDHIKDLIRHAKVTQDKRVWKQIHRERRRARREWEQQRLGDILNGDWHQYRALQKERKRRTGWWGRMLQGRSSVENTEQVRAHLSSKLVNEHGGDWDVLLQMQIDAVPVVSVFEPFTLLDIREVLQGMKTNSAVGPDGISVSFLRQAMSHDRVAPMILELVNDIVENLKFSGCLGGQFPRPPGQGRLPWKTRRPPPDLC